MARYLIIDGYNILNSWPEFKIYNEFESARNKLIEMIEDYRVYKGINSIIVFDAHLVKGSIEKHEFYGGLEIVYTHENETADAFIEKYVNEKGKRYDIVVATSDWLEQQIVLGRGATRISSRELRLEIHESQKKMKEKYNIKKSMQKNTIENNIDLEIYKKLDKIRRQH